jgi:transcription antitermination factor NusG
MQSWYALHTKPHKERQVEAVLTERGIEVYFPTMPAPRRRNRPAERAFFPCYLFAHADLDAVGLWSLHYVPGARGVVMFGGIPARVNDNMVVALRARLASADVVDARGEVLKQGDRVVITSGPFADWEGLFHQRLSASGRVRILLHLLQRWMAVEMDADALRKAPSRKL